MFDEIKNFLLNQYTIGEYLNEFHTMIELNEYMINIVDKYYNVHTFCFYFSFRDDIANCSYYRIIGVKDARIVQQFQANGSDCLNLYKEIEKLVKAKNES